MITLKKALSLKKEEIEEIKADITSKVEGDKLNAYISKPTFLDGDYGRVPILIKDNICVKDSEATCASKILKGFKSPFDAAVISKLHDNNMCAFGRANMDEFGMGSTTMTSCYGPTLNPVDTSRIPGGSSGGGAAAVASKIAIASLGSDTGGSVRQPSSYCGCVGLKPSYGRVSRYGLIAYSSSLEQVGTITQNVEDSAILLDCISGGCSKDSTCMPLKATKTFDNLDSSRTLKVGVLLDSIKDASKEVQEAYTKTIKVLESLGHKIVHKKLTDTSYQLAAYYIISTAEASSNLARFDGVRYGNRVEAKSLKDMYFNTRAQFGDEVKRRIMLGSFVLSSGYYDAYYKRAKNLQAMIKQEYEAIFQDCDVILSPVAPSVAPKLDAKSSPLEIYLSDIYTIGVNIAGLPAISVPVIKSPLPIGMQFIGRSFDEQSILDIAYGLELELNL
ncbi:Asp-tRNA(Asn)/Glu-tRNA(Gln) amidotransferase subunit GatA [Helicobacter sp. 11S02629-2]|uniref:Asp-tRNA(Asn)/Glu-tRNA(Gln) amidotransferase subunit GatA n=1 Tax=Helicobacter sp. 11S02629-2 TaxID=1476195 RepID=UPI000BA5C524|nr:Asp-tRNA(Asn)/Glu-tRNA(Gln) amidotransferase subunit GatA [Helicobacter sp. 11S02629-2]PAF45955.1 glutaminyl-tRNA synthase (glutamine-hydrolyzing) subunit A [Helicobacter sp. 11S02629-2]